MKNNTETFGGMNPFDLSISYVEIDSRSPLNVHDAHIHNECEIYINLSGDVSFSVENSIYPVMPGGIIITRPMEYHHCIYHSDKLHRHFWILFSASGNERFFDLFYKRVLGKNNLLMLPADKTTELFSLCHRMADGCDDEVEKYYCFFKLIHLLNSANAVNASTHSGDDFIIKAINYINCNLSLPLSVTDIAHECNVSVNTLERHFVQMLNITPASYIRKRRLANAAKLLSEGHTVTEAGEMSGFTDCSYFIATFKKAYQITPLQYRKSSAAQSPPALA